MATRRRQSTPQHPDPLAWTVDNQVRVHVDGAAYFARLYQLLSGPCGRDCVYLTGWRIDPTRQLAVRAANWAGASPWS